MKAYDIQLDNSQKVIWTFKTTRERDKDRESINTYEQQVTSIPKRIKNDFD